VYLINKTASLPIYQKDQDFLQKETFWLKTTLHDLNTELEPEPEP